MGTTTTTTQAPPTAGGNASSAKYQAALSFTRCMRTHGEPDFPDPSSNGTLNFDFAVGGKGGPSSTGIDRMSPQFISASADCRPLLPGGVPTPAQKQLALAEGLKFAQCMRGHGVPNYPDPTSSGVVRLSGNLNPGSPEFENAQKLCQVFEPGVGSK